MEISDKINLLITDVSRTTLTEQRIINRLFLSSNKTLKDLFGSEICVIGAAFNKVLLPNECVEATQFLTSKDLKQWSVEACHAINLETTKSSPSSEYDDDDDHSMDTILLSVNGNYVQCQRGKVGVQLSVNNIDGLLLTSSLEQFNNYIGNDNLFKRSFILIKMWIYNESRRFSYLDLSELFQHDSLAVMTMTTFAVSTTEIDNPLTALCCFLDTFSKMNWATSLVTATGILPKKSNSNVLESISSLKIYGESSSAKATLESIFEQHRSYFATSSEGDDAAGNGKSDADSDNSRDGNTISDGRNSPMYPLTSGCIMGPPVMTDDIVVVMGPFSTERNICGSCPSYFRRKNISEELRSIFGRGSFELSSLLAQLVHRNEGSEFIQKVFAYSNALQCFRNEDAPVVDFYIVDSTAAVFQTICSNLPSKFAAGISEGNSAFSESMTSGLHNSRVLQNLDGLIAHVVQVASKMVTEESIINLVVQALHRFGPMPIGEIGKQLQLMTRNPDFPKLLKKRFGGLKKFIFSHPEFFSREDNHNFNPVVFVVGQVAPHPSSTALKQPNAVSMPMPVPSQKAEARKVHVDYALSPSSHMQQQQHRIYGSSTPLTMSFDENHDLLQQRAKPILAISPPKHPSLQLPPQQQQQQLQHLNYHHHPPPPPQQQPQPLSQLSYLQQQHHHQNHHQMNHKLPQQRSQQHQQEYFFQKQDQYGLDHQKQTASPSLFSSTRGTASSAFGLTSVASMHSSQRPNPALVQEHSRAHTSSQYHLFPDNQYSFF